MTYKNHALDEFLKQIVNLEKCAHGALVRIGGQSQESELEKYNLRFLTRYVRSSSYMKDEINQMRDDINFIGCTLYESLNELHELQTMSKISFLSLLSKAQLENFFVNCCISYQLGTTKKGKNIMATPQWIRNVLLSYVSNKYGSLRTFVTKAYRSKAFLQDRTEKQCCYILDWALGTWILAFKKKLTELNGSFESNSQFTNNTVKTKKTEMDEQDLKDIISFRLEAAPRDKFHSEAHLFNLDYICSFNDFPSFLDTKESLLNVPNIWELSDFDKVCFIYTLMSTRMGEFDEFFSVDEVFNELESLMQSKRYIEEDKDIQVLRNKKVIGATITGAAIHQVWF